ncbi:MAG: VirD4-like conjugal transfer protein, CD1115 family [Thermacetogeniaceae bacterium]
MRFDINDPKTQRIFAGAVLAAAGLIVLAEAKVLFLALLFCAAAYFLCRQGTSAQKAAVAALPLAFGLMFAWVAAGVTDGAIRAAAAAKEGMKAYSSAGWLTQQKPQAPQKKNPVPQAKLDYRVWIGAEPPACPADAAGRWALLLGAGVGFLVAVRVRPAAKHGPGVVQGERVEKGGWADASSVSQVCAFGLPKEGDGGLVLGRLQALDAPPDRWAPVLRVKPGMQGMAAHTFVFGASGSGKTVNFVLPNIVSAALEGVSLVVSDPKGELVAGKYNLVGGKKVYTPGVAAWLQEKGYRVLILNFKNPTEGSHRWNPILEAKDESEFRRITEAMIYSKGMDSPFFAGGELNLFTALIGLVRYAMEPQYRHLRAVLSILSWPQEAIDAVFQDAYRSGKLPFYYYEKWQAAKPLYGNFMTGVQNKIAEVTEGPLARLMAGHDFDLESIGKNKTALFVILPTMGDLRPILACFYYMLFKRLIELAERNYGRLPIPVRFILDEFANIGRVPDFDKRISFDRGFGVNYVCILQSLAQFKGLYGASDTQTILSNADVQLCLRINDSETARYFANKLGEAETWHTSERRNVTTPWDRMELPKKTESLKKVPLLHDWQFRELPFYTGVALIPTCRPIPLHMVAFWEMKEFKEIPSEEKTIADFAPPVPDDLPLPEPPETGGEAVDLGESGNGNESEKKSRKKQCQKNKQEPESSAAAGMGKATAGDQGDYGTLVSPEDEDLINLLGE